MLAQHSVICPHAPVRDALAVQVREAVQELDQERPYDVFREAHARLARAVDAAAEVAI